MATSPNPVGAAFLLAWIILTILAVFGAKGRWKAYNLLIILGFMAAAMVIGAVAGLWAASAAFGGQLSANLIFPVGAVGAVGCLRRNKRRVAGSELPGPPKDP